MECVYIYMVRSRTKATEFSLVYISIGDQSSSSGQRSHRGLQN